MTALARRIAVMAGCAATVMAVQLSCVETAQAQARRAPRRISRPARDTPHAGSWEVSGGLLWQGGFDLGTAQAELTRNPGTGSGAFDLFSSGSKLGAGVGFQGRITGYVSQHLAIEGGLRLTRPLLTVSLTGDTESASNQSAEETLTQYVIDGSAVWHFTAARQGRVMPFVLAGAGYVRDLHEGSAFMETGSEYHAAAGLKWWLGRGPHRFGIRGEAGLSIKDGGFDFRDGRRTLPFAAASLAYLF